MAVDVGNSLITVGLHDGRAWRGRFRVRTVPEKTAEEYAVLLQSFLRTHGLEDRIQRVVLASAVPPLIPTFRELGEVWLGAEVLVVGPGVRTGLAIRTDNPAEVGPDLVADAVAAYARFGGPCIAVDFGTATSFVAVAAPGALVGVAIAPGLRTGLEALAERTAQLPRVPLALPPAVLGKNTTAAVQAGSIFGHAALVDGVIRRMRKELEGEAHTVATGEWASFLSPLLSEVEAVDHWLTLDGLRLISERNP
ncbi:MAG: type III pantothenate kinase [Candidatus Bipolaricaulota bacterium]|nr:type III pantothenate kinase [Candidatus Bipolaricaulota bacterium]MDW8127246.1 type III pantothenate kinase [Candidatus Bipolaricaulota bacterium]